jgi:hypothetical protein
MFHLKKAFVLVGFLTILFGVSASSADERGAFSLLGGLNVFSAGGDDFTYGGKFDYRMTPSVGLGLVATNVNMGSLSSSYTSGSFSMVHLNAELVYFLNDSAGLWIGARGGIALLMGTAAMTDIQGMTPITVPSNVSIPYLEVGPAVGYDYSFGNQWSVGLDVSFMFQTYSVFQGFGAVSYHF